MGEKGNANLDRDNTKDSGSQGQDQEQLEQQIGQKVDRASDKVQDYATQGANKVGDTTNQVIKDARDIRDEIKKKKKLEEMRRQKEEEAKKQAEEEKAEREKAEKKSDEPEEAPDDSQNPEGEETQEPEDVEGQEPDNVEGQEPGDDIKQDQVTEDGNEPSQEMRENSKLDGENHEQPKDGLQSQDGETQEPSDEKGGTEGSGTEATLLKDDDDDDDDKKRKRDDDDDKKKDNPNDQIDSGEGESPENPEETPEESPDGSPDGSPEGSPEGAPETTPESVPESTPESIPESAGEGATEMAETGSDAATATAETAETAETAAETAETAETAATTAETTATTVETTATTAETTATTAQTAATTAQTAATTAQATTTATTAAGEAVEAGVVAGEAGAEAGAATAEATAAGTEAVAGVASTGYGAIALAIIAVLILLIILIVLLVSASKEDDAYKIPGGGIYGNTAEEKIWYTFRQSYGLSEYSVSGMMGNIYRECSFDCTEIENGGTDPWAEGVGIGLVQWTYQPFKDALKAYSEAQGKDWTDLDLQIEFLIGYTLGEGPAKDYISGLSSVSQAWKNATSPEEAAEIFERDYEKSADTAGSRGMNIRTSKAREYYEEFQGKTIDVPGGGGTGGSVSDYGPVSTGDNIPGSNPTYRSETHGQWQNSKGKIFTIYDQVYNEKTAKVFGGSTGYCNRWAAATIASAYSNDRSVRNMLPSVNPMYDGGSYFSRFGLNIQQASVSISSIRQAVTNGKYALVWYKSPTYFTGSMHWVSILDYKNEGGQELVAVADNANGHSGWYNLNGSTMSGGLSECHIVSEK